VTVQPENYSPNWPSDTRPSLPLVGDEREILTGYLEWHRATFGLKCEGLTAAQLSTRAVPPSGMSLHGMARHLAAVERWWFRQQFSGEDVPILYFTNEQPNLDFDGLDGDPVEAFEAWRAECERSRAIVAATPDLERTGVQSSSGKPVSLRRILVHMIAEYARHNGHADLLRERLDGATGQ